MILEVRQSDKWQGSCYGPKVCFLSTGDPQSGCKSHSCETIDGMMQELHKAPTKQINELPEALKEMFPMSSKGIKFEVVALTKCEFVFRR